MSRGKTRRIEQVVEASITGFETAARILIVGMVILAGGSVKDGREVSNNKLADTMIRGMVRNLQNFAKAHLDILRRN